MNMKQNKGFALVGALLLLLVLMALLTAYFGTTRLDISNSAANAASTTGFYAAEAGLNLRAGNIDTLFQGFNRPTGTSPTGTNPCVGTGGTNGTGDFACQSFSIRGRNVATYLVETTKDLVNGDQTTIPVGEEFAGLRAWQYRYDAFSKALNPQGKTEAILKAGIRSRLVPLFQFAVFYQGDLEFNRTAPLTLAGPVHTNGNLFLDAGGGSTLAINGNVTAVNQIYRGPKDDGSCSGTVTVLGTSASCTSGTQSVISNLAPWGGGMLSGVPTLTVPSPSAFAVGGEYWNKAELRVMLNMNLTPPQVEVRNVSGTVNAAATAALTAGTAFDPNTGSGTRAADFSSSFYNNRELTNRPTLGPSKLLEINMGQLLAVLQASGIVNLADTTDGGLVFFFGVDGPNQALPNNNYGVRIRGGANLTAANSAIKGLTVVSDQALYVQGNYNSIAANWRPAALLSDSINVLSANWFAPENNPYRNSGSYVPLNTNSAFVTGTTNNIPNTCGTISLIGTVTSLAASQAGTIQGDAKSNPRCRNRWFGLPGGEDSTNWPNRWLPSAAATTINAAVLSGADITPSIGAPGGGGVHNMMRFHEHWGSNNRNLWVSNGEATLYGVSAGTTWRNINGTNVQGRLISNYYPDLVSYTYKGSLVSLNEPTKVNGDFFLGQPWYHPPQRIWSFDTNFNDMTKLPPLTPRAVFLKQDLFLRQFEQSP